MLQTFISRNGLSVALVTGLFVLAPPVVVVATLYALALALDVVFDEYFLALAMLSAALSVVLLSPVCATRTSLFVPGHRMATSLVLRWCVLIAILLLIGYATQFSVEFSRRTILLWAVTAPSALLLVSMLIRITLRRLILSRGNWRSAVIAGATDASLQLASRLREHPELCTRVKGFFDDRSANRLGPMDGFSRLGTLSELPAYVRSNRIDVIMIALPIRHLQRVKDLLDDLRDTTASLYFIPDLFTFDLIQARSGDVLGIPVVALCESPFFGHRALLKRAFDVTVTLFALVIALPLMLLIALAIKLDSRGPVLFRQRRYGLAGEPIVVWKFRSMHVSEDGAVIEQATRDDPRITRVGRVLRRFSLDELPQLFNVLQGRMSLVGPRPHAIAHNEQYRRLIKGYMIRHKVPPGITGLAQVNGCRGETAQLGQMQRRVAYDLDYLRHWTPMLDVKILLLTAVRLLHDRAAY